MKLHLQTTDSQLAGLWEAYHAKRRKGNTVQAVDVDALGALLKDHHALYSRATGSTIRGGNGIPVELGADQESIS